MNKHRKHDPDLDDDNDLSSYRINVKQEEDDESEGEGGAGTSGLTVEQMQAWLMALQTRELRQGEKRFGPVPDTQDPNELLGKQTRGQGFGAEIKAHPLLARTQRFSGDDPKLTARASENNKAAEEYVKEQLQNQLRNENRLTNTARKRVTLSR